MRRHALTWQQRTEIVAEVDGRIAALGTAIPVERACLLYAAYAAIAISRRGVRTVLQAGSASWPFKAREKDNGVGPTHYSYRFKGNDSTTFLSIMAGQLPEMHGWAAIPSTGEIVDLTTRHLRELLKIALPGEEWTAPIPPDYVWSPGAELPMGWRYEADAAAIGIAFDFLRRGRADVFDEMIGKGLVPPTLMKAGFGIHPSFA